MKIEELSWRGRPAQDLTKEELQVAFVELCELYDCERNRNKMRLEELEKTFGGAPMPAVNPWLKGWRK